METEKGEEEMDMLDKLPFLDSFKAEAAYRHQPVCFPRFNKENEPTLQHILPLIMQDKFSESSVVSANTINVTEFFKIENKVLADTNEVLSYNVFDAVMYQSEDGNLYPRSGENVTITVNFSEKKSLVLFVRGTYRGLDSTSYIRLSWSLQNLQDADDLKTFQSHSTPTVLSSLIACDFANPADLMSKYEACEKDVINHLRNSEEITDEIQESLRDGMFGRKSLNHYLGYADWLLSENRYTDALVSLKRAYEYMKSDFDELPPKWKEGFVETCSNIALCYSHLNDHDHTMFYASLVDNFKEHYPKAVEFLSTLPIPEQKQLPDQLTLGYILQVLFCIKKEQVKGLISVSNNQVHMTLPEDGNIWNLDTKKLFVPNTTIVLPYSIACFHTNSETDKSKLFYNNSIIIRCDAVDGGGEVKMQRITIIIPTFINDDEKQNASEKLVRPRLISFVYNGGATYKPANSSADALLENANILENNCCFMQALLEWERCSRVIDNNYEHFHLVSYKAGFCLSELQRFELALQYLFAAACMDMNVLTEFVNALCNSNDVRAMAIIDQLTQATGNDNNPHIVQFRKFLSRRKVYTLIEQGKLDKARESLLFMKNDPEQSKFAQSELDYINSLQ